MHKILKFLLKLPLEKKTHVQEAIDCILDHELAKLDIKPLQGYKGYFRCRIEDIRIIFCRNKDGGFSIVDVDYRSKIYRRWH